MHKFRGDFMFNYDKLENAIAKSGKTKTYLCQKLNRPAYYLRDVLKQKNIIPMEYQIILADELGVSVEWLNDESDIKEKAAPVSGNDFSLEDIEFLKAVDLLNPAMQRLLVAVSALDQEEIERFADLAESFAKSKER